MVVHISDGRPHDVETTISDESFMDTIIIAAERTLMLSSHTLADAYPSADFTVRLEDPLLSATDIRGVDVVWIGGPSREEIEDVLDHYQSVSWDPLTGTLAGRTHYNVSEKGSLIRVAYNIDYIFCDGPGEFVQTKSN